MATQTSSTPTLWALLIGVDCYLGQTIPGLPNFRGLSGCVNDIALMDAFLRTRLNVPVERIKKLTASGLGAVPQEAFTASANQGQHCRCLQRALTAGAAG